MKRFRHRAVGVGKVKNVTVIETKHGCIISWSKTRKKVWIEVLRDDCLVTTLYISATATKHEYNCEPGSKYEFRVNTGKKGSPISCFVGGGDPPPTPSLNLVEYNGKMEASCPQVPGFEFSGTIKIDQISYKIWKQVSVNLIERISAKQKVRAEFFARRLLMSGGETRRIEGKLKCTGILHVNYQIYYLDRGILITFFLEGNKEYEERLKEIGKQYSQADSITHYLKLQPGQSIRSRIKTSKTCKTKIHIQPSKGKKVSHSELIHRRYLEQTVKLNISAQIPSLTLYHTIDGKKTKNAFSIRFDQGSQPVPGSENPEETDFSTCESGQETFVKLVVFCNTENCLVVFYLDDKTTAKEVYNEHTGRGYRQIGESQTFEFQSWDLNIEARIFGPIEPSQRTITPKHLLRNPIKQQFTRKRDSIETTVRYELKQMGKQLLNFPFFVGEHGLDPKNEPFNRASVVTVTASPHGNLTVNAPGSSAVANQVQAPQ